MRTPSILRFLLLAVTLCFAVAAMAAPPDVPPGHQRYIVVLKRNASEPDVTGLGGKVVAKAPGFLYTTLPAPAVEALKKHGSVKYVQMAIYGTTPASAVTGAATRSVVDQSWKPAPNVAAPLWKSGDYAYDGAGNITHIGLTTNSSTLGNDDRQSIFLYDAASRLISANIQRLNGDRNETYNYDSFGNMTTRTVNGQAVGFGSVDQSTNRLALYSYDEAGNTAATAGGAATYDYDPLNMMRDRGTGGVPLQYYVYTPSDERIGVMDTGNGGGSTMWTWTFRDFDGKPLRQFQSPATALPSPLQYWTWIEDYAWRDGQLIGAERVAAEGGRRHFHVDHLGSPRLVTTQTAGEMSLHDFAPYGEEITSIQQAPNAGFDREDRMKFTGHERDYATDVTGENSAYLDYMHARYYGPVVGRFLAVDPVLQSDRALHGPQLWNRFTYVTGNPIRFSDPTGKYTCEGWGSECDAFRAGVVRLKVAVFEARRTGAVGATRLTDVMNFLGNENQANGVRIRFGQSQGEAQTVVNADTNVVTITFDRTKFMAFSNDDTSVAAAAAHESEHGLMERADHSLTTTHSKRKLLGLEHSAYRTQSYIYSGLGLDDQGYHMWSKKNGFDPSQIDAWAQQSVALECGPNDERCLP